MKIKGSRTTQERFSDDKVIDRAMRMAVKAALLRHKRAGVSIVVWRSGKVVRIKPNQIKLSRDGRRRSPATRPSRSITGSRRRRRTSG
jgi:hypothetical protein